MSHQYPGPQQPYQGPAPYQPPPPPKKRMGPWKIVGITLGGFFALLIVLGIALGDGSDDKADTSSDKPAAAPKATASTQAQDPDDTLQDTIDQNQKNLDERKKQRDAEAKKDGQYGEGDYVVGEDMPAGTYTTTGAKAGAFEFCSVTTEPTGDAKFPQLKSANKGERIIITLTKADGVVTIQGCEPLTLRK